ncbi:MAG: deoxyribodipyrimidine photo-lyase, partial [Actinomycetota bacterium]|nr:deoxyribodipyrimidine photo-lyase [Actinomycetota bacterium]
MSYNIHMEYKRARKINNVAFADSLEKPVLYWMSREQRISDNWGLLYAQQAALKSKVKLFIVFCLSDKFLNAGNRHYLFMLDNLKKCIRQSFKKNIPLYLLMGNPEKEIIKIMQKLNAGMLVTDFDPLKIKINWKKEISKQLENLKIPFYEVDGHNIVPAWVVSQKKEWG